MRITYLGHAGFCVETEHAVVIMDPWMSATGAFDSSWFQFPRNHHLASFVDEKLGTEGKQRLLYISHEHKDHFDIDFLNSLTNLDFSLVVAAFRRPELRNLLAGYPCKGVIACPDGERVPFAGGFLKLYLDDSELNRDSAVLVHADGQTFFNMNDCKLYDRVAEVARDHSPISVFASQFSGATWHPTCYEYPREKYEAISASKRASKFESVARSIETLAPAVYLPSAGPPCFLDPRLMRLNFEPVNIFPRAPMVVDFLRGRLSDGRTQFLEMVPGDVLDVGTQQVVGGAREGVRESDLEPYIRDYAADRAGIFEKQQVAARQIDAKQVLCDLSRELVRKLDSIILGGETPLPLYFRLEELSDTSLRVDFHARRVELMPSANLPTNFYSITTPAWQVARVLERAITWEDFALAFRVRLRRNPDVYQTLLNGFLFEEAEDLPEFCRQLHNINAKQERIEIVAGECTYEVDRYCPHQGGDLAQGWVEDGHLLVCPRHRWKFDLADCGRCTTNNTSIRSTEKERVA